MKTSTRRAGRFTGLVTGIDPGNGETDEGRQPPGRVWCSYQGPRPPAGDEPHRYAFRVFALGDDMPLEEVRSADDARECLHEAALAAGTLVGLYAR